jgi:hypothetical protein
MYLCRHIGATLKRYDEKSVGSVSGFDSDGVGILRFNQALLC